MDAIDTMYAEDYYKHPPKSQTARHNNHVPADITAAGLELHNQQMLEVSGREYTGPYTPTIASLEHADYSWNAAQNTMEISYEIPPTPVVKA